MPYCGANPIADMWSEKAMTPAGRRRSGPRCATATTRTAREQMALAATFAGMGFGNAGVHIPHANAYPIAGRVRDFHPEGYPDDEPMVPHGMAVVADRARGVPVHLRGRARAAPARRRAARAGRRRGPTTCATSCRGAAPT